jgi:5-formyltetrahydrofolate cyclo-ligase
MAADDKQSLRAELRQRWADLWPEPEETSGLPKFPGLGRAAQRLRSCAEYQTARSVLAMAEPPLLQARINLLMDKGRFIAATPGLKKGLVRIEASQVPVPRRSRDLRGGALAKAGKVLRFPKAKLGRIDLVLVSGLAVDRSGVILGDGRGLADLAWAVLVKLGGVSRQTKVAALLDDPQIMDRLPSDPWDLMADLVVTPGEIIRPSRPIRPRPPVPAALPEHLASLPLVRAVWNLGGPEREIFEDEDYEDY